MSPEAQESSGVRAAQGSEEKTSVPKKSNGPVDPKKRAEAWVEDLTKPGVYDHPAWREIVAALDKKYGKGKTPCSVYETARWKYFEDFMRPLLLKQGIDVEGAFSTYMKLTELPREWTLWGKKPVGCLEH